MDPEAVRARDFRLRATAARKKKSTWLQGWRCADVAGQIALPTSDVVP